MVLGEDLVLTSNGKPVAIVIRSPLASWPCQPTTAKQQADCSG